MIVEECVYAYRPRAADLGSAVHNELERRAAQGASAENPSPNDTGSCCVILGLIPGVELRAVGHAPNYCLTG